MAIENSVVHLLAILSGVRHVRVAHAKIARGCTRRTSRATFGSRVADRTSPGPGFDELFVSKTGHKPYVRRRRPRRNSA